MNENENGKRNGCGCKESDKEKTVEERLRDKIPLEDAPLETFLMILRDEGYEEDALIIERFYVELLTNVDMGDGERFTEEQVMKTPYKNLVEAADRIMGNALEEMENLVQQTENHGDPNMPSMINNHDMGMTGYSGRMMRGKGADQLSDHELEMLMARQLQLSEEAKMKLALR